MTHTTPPGPAPGALSLEPAERLSADDMATRREAEFLAAAMRQQQLRGQADRSEPGRCRYCKARCLPAAVFCDEDCRSDWEAEQAVLRRQGRAR